MGYYTRSLPCVQDIICVSGAIWKTSTRENGRTGSPGSSTRSSALFTKDHAPQLVAQPLAGGPPFRPVFGRVADSPYQTWVPHPSRFSKGGFLVFRSAFIRVNLVAKAKKAPALANGALNSRARAPAPQQELRAWCLVPHVSPLLRDVGLRSAFIRVNLWPKTNKKSPARASGASS